MEYPVPLPWCKFGIILFESDSDKNYYYYFIFFRICFFLIWEISEIRSKNIFSHIIRKPESEFIILYYIVKLQNRTVNNSLKSETLHRNKILIAESFSHTWQLLPSLCTFSFLYCLLFSLWYWLTLFFRDFFGLCPDIRLSRITWETMFTEYQVTNFYK